MAKKVVKFEVEIDSVESLINAFRQWRDMKHEDRLKVLKDEKRIVVKIPEPKKDGAYSVSFYSDGAAYVSFGRNKSIELRSGADPVSKYVHKDGTIDRYHLVRSDCTDYYSVENKALVGALSKSF